ncbi:MAG: hypothetical protein JO322_04770, partial [Candidatus Eremiobacteraeota bacterium]|nr:hypothetical protein [Candidatus Eremiobacteraeota bacterium]
MNDRTIAVAGVALLGSLWWFDHVTPIAYAPISFYALPVFLAAFAKSRRLIYGLASLAIVANSVEAYFDFHVNPLIALEIRSAVYIAILLVAVLSILLQNAVRRNAELAEKNRAWAEREAMLRCAVETMRSSLDSEHIDRTIVREAASAFDSDVAWLFKNPEQTTPVTFRFQRGSADPDVSSGLLSPQAKALVDKASAQTAPVSLERGEAADQAILDAVGANHVLAARLFEQNRLYGVLAV